MTELLRPDLNDFLFSPIANDANGMHLTVLSALARLDSCVLDSKRARSWPAATS